MIQVFPNLQPQQRERFSGEILSGDQKHRHRQPNDVLLLNLVVNQGIALVVLGALASLGAWLFAERAVIGSPPRKCPACEEAEAYLDRVSEPRVSPCDDFYEHVCGRWGAASSFEEALKAEGERAMRDTLTSYPKGFRQAYATFEKLAAYYRSCYMDLESRHDIAYFVKRFSDTTGLRWDTLIAKRSTDELIDVLVGMSARFAVSVLIKVVTFELKYSFVVSPLRDDELVSASTMTTLLEKVIVLVNRSLQGDPLGVANRTQELHRKVLDAYQGRDRNESRLLGDAKTALPHLGLGDTASWLQAVERHTRVNVTNDSTVALDSPKLLKATLQLFALADDMARSVYLFAHVVNAVSAVLDLNAKVDGRPEFASQECLRRINVKELSAARRSFAVSTLAPQRTVISIREMMTLVTLQLVKRVSLNRRVETSARILLSQSLRSYSYKSVFSGPYLNMSRLESAYQSFPAMPNLYQESLWRAHFLVPEEVLNTCASGKLLTDENQEMCLSPYVLLPPMVYGEADKFFNYASLGFFMATRIVHAFLSPKTRTEEEERAVSTLLETANECHKRSGDVQHAADVMDALSFVLGLRSALEAYRTWAASVLYSAEKTSLLRTFFRRACLTVCSKPSSGHKPHGGSYGRFSSRQACNVAVRSMPEFFVAFKCTIVHNMSRNGICTLF